MERVLSRTPALPIATEHGPFEVHLPELLAELPIAIGSEVRSIGGFVLIRRPHARDVFRIVYGSIQHLSEFALEQKRLGSSSNGLAPIACADELRDCVA
jgi:hypothetical protein